jgi:hypothetical protein
MKRAKEWTNEMKVPSSHKDFTGLPEWLQKEIVQDLEVRAPKGKPVLKVSQGVLTPPAEELA